MSAEKIITSPNPNLKPKFGLDADSLIISSGENHLPHWECNKAVYHVTYRLADSIPYSILQKWVHERDSLIEAAKMNTKILKMFPKTL